MSPDNMQRRVNGLREDFKERVRALAAEVREDVIIPLCERHNLAFHYGMFTQRDKPTWEMPGGLCAQAWAWKTGAKEGSPEYQLYQDLEAVGAFLRIEIEDDRECEGVTAGGPMLQDFIASVDFTP